MKGIKKSDLSKIKIIVVEINFWDFYTKSTSFYEIEKKLNKNFKFWSISSINFNPKYLSVDHIDAVYVNKLFIKK